MLEEPIRRRFDESFNELPGNIKMAKLGQFFMIVYEMRTVIQCGCAKSSCQMKKNHYVLMWSRQCLGRVTDVCSRPLPYTYHHSIPFGVEPIFIGFQETAVCVWIGWHFEAGGAYGMV